MRVGLVRKVWLAVLALGVVGLGGCNDAPLDVDATTAVRMLLNPSSMVVRTGDTVLMRANGINNGNEPTFEPVTATVATCGGSGGITVVESDLQTAIEPPQTYDVIGGAALGAACIVVQSGSATDTVDVVVVGGSLEIVSSPTPLVVAGTGTVVVDLIGIDGTPVTPFDPTDVAWSSDNTAVLTVDASGNVASPGLSGNANITATWTGTDATGTTGQGVSLSAVASIDVVADDPVAAAYSPSADFGAIGAGAQSTLIAFVSDALGNQVVDPAVVTGITATSDDPSVATASTFYDPDALQNLSVTATSVASGTANISGTVMTTFGDFAFGPAPVTVLAHTLTSLSVTSGPAGTTTILTGTEFIVPGFTARVFVDGTPAGNFTIISPVQAIAQMGTFTDAGDHTVTVDIGGVQSNGLTFTQDAPFSDAASEPGNDGPGAASMSLPASFPGTLLCPSVDCDDFFQFTLSDAVTINISLSWQPATGDLDLLFTDAAVTAFQCGFVTATGADPESGTCALAPGAYQAWVDDFGADDVSRTYLMTVTVAP